MSAPWRNRVRPSSTRHTTPIHISPITRKHIASRETHAVSHTTAVEHHLTAGKGVDPHPARETDHAAHAEAVGVWCGLSVSVFNAGARE
jgi:hypothetical protein